MLGIVLCTEYSTNYIKKKRIVGFFKELTDCIFLRSLDQLWKAEVE